MLGEVFRIHNLILLWSSNPQKWGKPPISFMKVNMDVAVYNNKSGFRVIIRDCDGFVRGGCVGYKGDHSSIEWVEIDALVKGISMACSFNFDHVIF
ncbi:hypothetical protein J1N35_025786 [Gossypium stocksii]|uniref:RNase H type-1 domain-containing protein n=1 Tax=Gossypium stocksii TaxID=47602 RepID=A0A9D3ZYL4_9ROSI|nr:hypothetical protein J1N35_025786 [Gossypium stocksii]